MKKELILLVDNITIYRCTYRCPINKKCFIIKTANPLVAPLVVLQKCSALKRDVKITIGDEKPP